MDEDVRERLSAAFKKGAQIHEAGIALREMVGLLADLFDRVKKLEGE